MLDFIRDVIAFGMLGLLIESVFTGVKSLLKYDITMQTTSYLWMVPIYGLTGYILMYVNVNILGWSTFALRGLVSTFIIYAAEFISGYLLEALIGSCPWRYTDEVDPDMHHRFSLMGYIRIDYGAYWFILAVAFDYFSDRIISTINHLSQL